MRKIRESIIAKRTNEMRTKSVPFTTFNEVISNEPLPNLGYIYDIGMKVQARICISEAQIEQDSSAVQHIQNNITHQLCDHIARDARSAYHKLVYELMKLGVYGDKELMAALNELEKELW